MKIVSNIICFCFVASLFISCSSDDNTINNENLLFGKWDQPVTADSCAQDPGILFGYDDSFVWNIAEASECEDTALPFLQLSGKFLVEDERLVLTLQKVTAINNEDSTLQFSEGEVLDTEIQFLTELNLQLKTTIQANLDTGEDDGLIFSFRRDRLEPSPY